MREVIQAMRAVWASWYEGKDLAFRGEFYSHTSMTPMFTPAERIAALRGLEPDAQASSGTPKVSW